MPRRRWPIFFATLLITAGIALAMVYGREPLYRATTTVLKVQPGPDDTADGTVDIHHRLLHDEAILQRLAAQLTEEDREPWDVSRLRATVSSVPVPASNLLELRAEGSQALQLQRIVNLWPESYEAVQTESLDSTTRDRIAEIEAEQQQLGTAVTNAQQELQRFHSDNDLSALRREQKRAADSQKDVQRSIAKVRRQIEKLEARKSDNLAKIAAGEIVATREQRREIASIEREINRMQKKLDKFFEQYTAAFLERDPAVRELPAAIAEKQRELQALTLAGREAVIGEIDRDIASEREALEALESQLTVDDTGGSDSKHLQLTQLEDAVAGLKRQQAEKADELALLRQGQLASFPPLQIVARAVTPTVPIHPNYSRDALFALGIALGIAFLVTWLFEYRTEVRQGGSRNTPSSPEPKPRSASPELGPLEPSPIGSQSRELAPAEVAALLAGCDASVTAYAALLLSGVSPYELPLLHAACFDHDRLSIDVPGAAARALTVNERTWSLLEAIIDDIDNPDLPLPVGELEQRIAQAARQAVLSTPDGIGALTLWHTYLVFLVRQGIAMQALEQRAGNVPRETYDAIAHLAPRDSHKVANEINFTYPTLA
jgi:hypothetical protein